ncbi:ribosome hibernation-promoting factor, HPF/YfiA family [Marinitenerispora sediminis]|uniref:Ribosome hibernation promoting factor n=1 Tax=Marinitenerispora sediminis TaxID=1931232 RepID=A0A368T3N9_9ACTN|nr:ribosome-associated translation inhibitor RaiA [Marinitenerispora sediminis]RCV55706.1 ribosome-associated translation inhibitor RaiA [Marinitenerispora sediminis]RCV56727.1 ribosome-associated translation inhibitor RaiA [Marinitenerispora sediminis]RCV56756.1 ribosome-associated translation inhibitor RaiA [Marinitenerispora sediminis]
MDIIVKGRRTAVSEKFRQHVATKLTKLAKWEHKGMSVDVEVSKERNPKLADQRERVELTIHSSGPVIRGEASADDRYTALDLAMTRVEARLRKLADRRKVHKGSNRAPVSVAAATAELAGAAPQPVPTAVPTEPAPEPARAPAPAPRRPARAADAAPDEELIELDTQGEVPVIVREKFHYAKPMTIDQALMEMELVGHDFYLFRDEERDAPSVVYRRKGFNYGVLRLME